MSATTFRIVITPSGNDELWDMYTVGRHPTSAELYVPDLDGAGLNDVRAVLSALLAEANPADVVVGKFTFRTIRQVPTPRHLVHCDPAAAVDLLELVDLGAPAAPPPPLPPAAECPVCFDQPVVPRVCPRAFTEGRPGKQIWCANGHGVCTGCASRCTTRGDIGFVFRCPVCRAAHTLSRHDVAVFVLGSQHRATLNLAFA